MCEIPSNYLLTYDPKFIERHDDSSDFDEACVPIVAPKLGNHNLVTPPKRAKLRKTRNREKPRAKPDLFIDCDKYPVKMKHEHLEGQYKQSEEKVRKEKKRLNSGDQIPLTSSTTRSKLSLMKHKLIPCLSNIFKRTSTSTKHLSIIQENRAENTTSTENYRCSDCEHRRARKYNKTQNFAVQPVYAIEGVHNPSGPFRTSKATNEPIQTHNRVKCKNHASPCRLTSSSESDSQSYQERQHKIKMFRKRLKYEIMKEHSKYQETISEKRNLKNQHHQYPSKDHKGPYHVFSTPYQSRTNMTTSQRNEFLNDIPSSSSSFWEFLFDKVGRKYQTQRLEMPRPCNCTDSTTTHKPCIPNNCENMEKRDTTNCVGGNLSMPGNSCSCKSGPGPRIPSPLNDLIQQFPMSGSPAGSAALRGSPLPQKPQKKDTVICKCYDQPKNKSDSLDPLKQSDKPFSSLDNSKPCQECHDDVTNSLARKYNGEILCIHNPPCILINGCLNLPPQKEQPQMTFWPVEMGKSCSKKCKIKSKRQPMREQACQYHAPFVEVCQVSTTYSQYKDEKNVQSICHHDPPCEVVRGCCKTKYDPQLQNSCVHVPMCKKIPECTIGKPEGSSCSHRPRCPEMPVCSRNYVFMTARDTISTQVKPQCYVCRHVPPCLMIPKCLGKTLVDAYIPIDSLSDCTHQPTCDTIPACFRRSNKDMVSVSSQFPNPCRIV